jgi:hypothetical protein
LRRVGGEGDQFICFFHSAATCGKYFKWVFTGTTFEVNDSFRTTGGGLCVDDGINAVGSDQCSELATSDGALRTESIITAGALGAAGATTLCRNASNQIATCSSSARYKDDITALAFDGEKLLALRPVQFQWKETGEPGVGLVAEEVAEVLPELVTYNDKGEVEGVRYDQLTVYLLELLKQHEKELAELRSNSGDGSVTGSAGVSLGSGQFALVLAAAVAAAAVMAAATTLVVIRTGRGSKAAQAS